MSTRVTEITKTFRVEEGSVWDVLAGLQAQGWCMHDHEVPEGKIAVLLVHPSLPGAYRLLEGDA